MDLGRWFRYPAKCVQKYTPPVYIFPGGAYATNDPQNVLRMMGNVCHMYRLTDRVQIVAENELF